MIILIDFENTHASGFQGVEYLNEQDTLVVYYSDENSAVNKGVVDDLKAKNVHVRMVKLLKQHSNALDMYIASTTGMFLDTGEKICIVSKDKGYAAVRDFWHSLRGAEILLGETIEECFLHSIANDDERIRRAKERSQKALLTEAFETMNNIPTRPTLSRNRFWRRGRQVNYDLSSHLNPVEILPNPLAKPSQEEEYTLTDNELENLKEFLEEENLIAKEDSVDVVEIESSPELDGENQNKTLAEKNVEQSFPENGLLSEAKLPSSINSIAEEEVKKEESSSMNGSVLLEELPKTETAQTFKAAPNQVRYVWDAVKKAMIKVEEELEGSLDQPSVGASTLLAEEENDITEGKKEKRRRNSRRRHSGKKTEEGTESKDSKEKIESKDNKEVSGEAELPLVPEKGAIEKKTKQSAPKDRKDKGSSTGNNPEKPGLDKEDPKKEDPKEENPKKENLEKKDSKKEDPKKGNPKKENPKRENLKKKDSKKKDSEDKDSQNPEIVKKDMQTQGTKKDVEKRETEKTDNNIEVKKKSRRRPSRSRKKQVEEEVKEDSKENDSN